MSAVLERAEPAGSCVRFFWSDGFGAVFASAWLLDNAPSARVSGGGQRLRTARSLGDAGALRDAVVADDTARLRFENEILTWTGAQLRARASRTADAPDGRVLWPRGADIAARPVVPYASYLKDDAALKAVLSDVAAAGVARLAGAGTELDELERAVARFGFIRETNYGRLFEVRVAPDPDNLANTARALEPHTDNPYRDPVPTLQVLQCIRDSGVGGATTFLDGFAVAAWFCEAYPQDFARLATRAVPFAFADSAGNRYETRTPVLRTTVGGTVTGIRFNHRALGAVDFGAAETALWYESYLKFAQAADETARALSLPLRPGDIVLFDNERILHGREVFSGLADRLLKGCYCDRDALRATLARLDRPRS